MRSLPRPEHTELPALRGFLAAAAQIHHQRRGQAAAGGVVERRFAIGAALLECSLAAQAGNGEGEGDGDGASPLVAADPSTVLLGETGQREDKKRKKPATADASPINFSYMGVPARKSTNIKKRKTQQRPAPHAIGRGEVIDLT